MDGMSLETLIGLRFRLKSRDVSGEAELELELT